MIKEVDWSLLQSFIAVLQAPLPLQAFTPKHCTFSAATAPLGATAAPPMSRAAAVAAMVAPDFAESFMILFPSIPD